MNDGKGLGTGTLLALACCTLLSTGGAALAAEISVTTDGRYQLVNKVNGSERWMLAREFATGRIVANVFDPNDPLDLTFFDCVQTGADGVNYFFFCNISAGGSAWSGAGLENIPVARSFFGEGEPPPPPPGDGCSPYPAECASPGIPPGPFDLHARGGRACSNQGEEVLLDGTNGDGSLELFVSTGFSILGSFRINAVDAAGNVLVISLPLPSDAGVIQPDGSIVFENPGITPTPLGPTAVCGTVTNPQSAIRTGNHRLVIRRFCEVGGPVVGSFEGDFQLGDGSTCQLRGQFSMLRTQ